MLKTKLWPLMEVIFNFHSSQTKLAIKKNHTLAEELKEGANFAFKVGSFPRHIGHSYLYVMDSIGLLCKMSIVAFSRCQSSRKLSI